jgi:hypothetical protein
MFTSVTYQVLHSQYRESESANSNANSNANNDASNNGNGDSDSHRDRVITRQRTSCGHGEVCDILELDLLTLFDYTQGGVMPVHFFHEILIALGNLCKRSSSF